MGRRDARVKAQLTYESAGETPFGDPQYIATVEAPHPLAGKQFLLRSTANCDPSGKAPRDRWLIDGYPERPGFHEWHGAIGSHTIEKAIKQLAEYVDWLWTRERIYDAIEINVGGLRNAVDRFRDSFEGISALDYEKEWQTVVDEVHRIQTILAELADIRHAYTPHGHPCCGEARGPRPDRIARCGGPRICSDCARAAAIMHGQERP